MVLADSHTKMELEFKVQRIAMLSTQPIYIFRELMQHLIQQRIVTPSYRFLQEVIGRVVASERRRVIQLHDRCRRAAASRGRHVSNQRTQA